MGPPEVKDLDVVLEVAKMLSTSMAGAGGPDDIHQAKEVEDGDDIVGGDRGRGVVVDWWNFITSNSFHNFDVYS